MQQFNLQQLRFDDMVLTTDEDGQPIATTHGDGWYALTTQEQIDGINASISGNGEVWVKRMVLCATAAHSQPYIIFTTGSKTAGVSQMRRSAKQNAKPI